MKISFEIILHIYRNFKIKYPKCKDITNNFIKNNIYFIDEHEDINSFFDSSIKFHSRPFYIELIKILDSTIDNYK